MSKLTNQELKQKGYELLNFNEVIVEDFLTFIDCFPKSGKVPRGMKKDKTFIDALHNAAQVYRDYKAVPMIIQSIFSQYTEEDIDKIVDSFIKDNNIETILKGKVTFINESSMSQKRFIETADMLFTELCKLQGFHKKSLIKPISVIFKKASIFRSKALYKSDLDEIWIKGSANVGKGTSYGSIPYILWHELGHRYEHQNKLPDEFESSKFYTTHYSRADSFSGSEAFAEMFAISHDENSYPEFKEKIELFKKMMIKDLGMKKERTLDF